MEISSYQIGIAFLAGLATMTSPCALPFPPMILTYYLQERESTLSGILGGAVVLGGLVTFALPFGLFITLFKPLVNRVAEVAPYFELVAGGLLVLLGILTIVNIHTRFFSLVPSARPQEGRGYRPLYTLGVLYGASAIGCTIWPFLTLGLFASLSGFNAVVLYSVYIATIAAPVLVMGFFSGEVRDVLAAKLAQFSRGIRVAAGITVLLAGLWLINFGFDLTSTIENPPPVLADCFYEGNCPICYFEGTCNEYGFPLKPGEETLYSP